MVMFLFVIAYLGDRARARPQTRRHRRPARRSSPASAIFVETVLAVSDSTDLLDVAGARWPTRSARRRPSARLFLTDYLLAFEVDLADPAGGGDRRRRARRRRPAARGRVDDDEPGEREPKGERYDLRRELQRRERDEQERESEVGA